MLPFKTLWQEKDNPKVIDKHLGDFLIADIYSPLVVRQAYVRWSELPDYIQEGICPKMQTLIQNSSQYSNATLQYQIHKHVIHRAIDVLLQYKNCRFPLTDDASVPTYSFNFLSQQGEKNLKTLVNSVAQGHYTYSMYELAQKCSHKFLLDLDNYKSWHLDFRAADSLDSQFHTSFKGKKEPETYHLLPILQLTKGCVNQCSHCIMCAEPHLSHMPYVMFLTLHKDLMKYYKYYEGQEGVLGPFDRFFADSDSIAYQDKIMGADAGDIALKLANDKNPLFFLSKGITDKVSKRALAKSAMVVPIRLSFVDAPQENKAHGIRQIQESIRLVQSVPHHQKISVEHLCLKSGPSVSDDIFLGVPSKKVPIHAGGRANDLPKKETLLIQEKNDLRPLTIQPDGSIICCELNKGYYRETKLNDLFSFKKSHIKG